MTAPAPAVDLATGSCGIVTFRNGVRFFSLSVGRIKPLCLFDLEPVPPAQDECSVRVEDGVYHDYMRDGRSCFGDTDWDIVAFEPCSTAEARAQGVPWRVRVPRKAAP